MRTYERSLQGLELRLRELLKEKDEMSERLAELEKKALYAEAHEARAQELNDEAEAKQGTGFYVLAVLPQFSSLPVFLNSCSRRSSEAAGPSPQTCRASGAQHRGQGRGLDRVGAASGEP